MKMKMKINPSLNCNPAASSFLHSCPILKLCAGFAEATIYNIRARLDGFGFTRPNLEYIPGKTSDWERYISRVQAQAIEKKKADNGFTRQSGSRGPPNRSLKI